MRRRLAWSAPKPAPKPGHPGHEPAPGAASAPEPTPAPRTPSPPAPSQSGPRTAAQAAPSAAPETALPASPAPRVAFADPGALERALLGAAYVADDGLSTAAFLALRLGKPLLLEGAPGVGKTEAGKSLAAVLGRELIRLQCYEGLDASGALYEWNYARQILAIRRADDTDIYADEFLIERPLLAALRAPRRTALLIDEIDRSDHEFEAFLLEFLSDFQISIPETGTLRAPEPPVVVLTSNRTRELHEALRRRCVYHWLTYPDPDKETEIIMLRAPGVAASTARAVVAAVGELRALPLAKPPGVAEAVDWAEAAELLAAGGERWPSAFRRAIGVALKDEEDLAFTDERLEGILERATA